MQFSIDNTELLQVKTDCLVVGMPEGKSLTSSLNRINKPLGGSLKRLFISKDISGEKGHMHLFSEATGINANRLLVVGLGDPDKFTLDTFQSTLRLIYKKIEKLNIKDARIQIADWPIKGSDMPSWVQAAAVTIENSTYQFNEFKSKPKNKKHTLKKISFGTSKVTSTKKTSTDTQKDAVLRKQLAQGKAIAEGMALCRDLGNTPPNICNPGFLVKTAQSLAKQFSSISTKVIDEKQLTKMGAGAFMAVSKGSDVPGNIILLEYRGAAKSVKPHVLVGKGITFDSGGISLKPGSGMDEMKYDMCGAASVIGTMLTVAKLKLKLNLVVAVAAAENMPSGKATRPGDIVTTLSGQTVEILNTDAEGRLVLCDTLTYIARYKPKVVIDVATLTGACIIALGSNSALLSNNHQLADNLLTASTTSGDRAWQLPLWDEYKKMLDSPFADMANISSGRAAGTITAGCFLSKFTEDYDWAHLDIAGAAWKSGKEKNATGRPVPLLSQYLINEAG